MGAKGSGRHFRFDTRLYTEDFRNIDIREFNQKGWLNNRGVNTLTWNSRGEKLASVQFLVETPVQFPNEISSIRMKYNVRKNGSAWQKLDYRINLTTTQCNYGGVRHWFSCPDCNRRVCVLYCDIMFKCRSCHELVHKSRNESSLDQITRRLNKEKNNLWPELELGVFDSVRYLDKPKWMRLSTYVKKKIELARMESRLYKLMIDRFETTEF
jgi:hypothetical protein